MRMPLRTVTVDRVAQFVAIVRINLAGIRVVFFYYDRRELADARTNQKPHITSRFVEIFGRQAPPHHA